MSKRALTIWFSLGLTLLAGPATSTATKAASAPASLPDGIAQVTSVEGIDEYRLTNGLRVLLFPDLSKQTATVNITYLVGSRSEGYGETGMAHLLEHMVFKGTPRHPKIPDELTSHGCRPNGSTWFDRTNYFETFSATEENLAWALDLEADRMINSFIAKKDLESEMTVVRNEFETGENNPKGVLEERIMSTAYLWHNYGKSTIGTRADIENVPIENLQAFYRRWYQPDNAVLVVAGNIDTGKTLKLIHDTFGKIPRPERELPMAWTVEPAQDGERTVTLRRVGDTPMVSVAYHIPSGSHPDFAAIDMLTFILGDAPSGRLYKALVETKKAVTVNSWAYQLKEPGVLFASAELMKDGSLDAIRDEVIRLVEAAGASLPSPEEFERARENLLKQWELSMRNSERAAIGLSEWSAMGDWRMMFVHRDRLRQVVAADIQRVAQSYLKTSNRTVGSYIPTQEAQRAEIPGTPDLEGVVKNYKGGEALAKGEEFDSSPDQIESQLIRSSLPVGLKMTLLPKKTRGSTVQVALSLHLGDEKSLAGLARVGELTASMLTRGSARHSRQMIKDEWDRLRTNASVYGSATGASASLEVTRENLTAALSLLAEILREPVFPDSELTMLKRERLVGLEDSKHEPSRLAMTAMQRHMNPYPIEDVRYVPTPDEEIAQTQDVTLDQLSTFHRDFYGAMYGELAVTGDFDPKEIQDLASELFGDWKNRQPYVRIPSAYSERPPIHEVIEVPDKEGAVFLAGLKIKMRDDDPDYAPMTLANFMTGGGFLNSRLATRLRQKEGLSYGAGSYFFASSWDQDAYFGSRAIYAPQNAEQLETAWREEIQKVVDGGFTPQEIADAKSGWLQSRRVSRSQDRELVWSLTTRQFQNRTLEWDAQIEKRVAELTPEEILAAVKRCIDPKKISAVRAGDFAKSKKNAATARPSSPQG